MLHAERPRLPLEFRSQGVRNQDLREILLAVAPPPRTPSFFLSGWPSWLVPAARSGGHRSEPEFELFSDEGTE